MAIDISSLSLEDLRSLKSGVGPALAKAELDERKSVYEEIKAICISRGYDLGEIVSEFHRPSSSRPARRGKRPPKYRNPSNYDDTWSGLSRKPQWFKDALARGVSEEDMLIDKA